MMQQRLFVILILFLPALGAIAGQSVATHSMATESMPTGTAYLAIALILLGLDQARMAIVDLQQIDQVQHIPDFTADPSLQRFRWVTLSTIGIELAGFYGAIGELGWGAIVILLSQLWFHGLAGIQLRPGEERAIVPFGLRPRLPVLIADGVGIGLIILWMQNIAPLAMALGLLGMVLAYGLVKMAQSASFMLALVRK